MDFVFKASLQPHSPSPISLPPFLSLSAYGGNQSVVAEVGREKGVTSECKGSACLQGHIFLCLLMRKSAGMIPTSMEVAIKHRTFIKRGPN
ncbi:hypothetical protein AXF42_Ash010348 [Apostasia shenzhenica]|uniref:Uncharacterized protein n=1 Tax=Apostasia shenzhenica TaxID=1088818 RepID=A0A2I0BDR4_9ASPA|nr:hypothetical protein AXF42_Ash010348 [Apostasia shenzhenica]